MRVALVLVSLHSSETIAKTTHLTWVLGIELAIGGAVCALNHVLSLLRVKCLVLTGSLAGGKGNVRVTCHLASFSPSLPKPLVRNSMDKITSEVC